MSKVEAFPTPKPEGMRHNGEFYLGSDRGVDYYLAACELSSTLTLRFERDNKRYDIGINKQTLRGLKRAYDLLYEFNRGDWG